MATSTSWPLPVCVRWNSAEATPSAAVAPDITSAPAKPTRVGPFVGKPVIDIRPDIAWIMPSNAAVSRSGPTWPKPDTAQ